MGAGYVLSAGALAWLASSNDVNRWVGEAAHGPDHEMLQWQKNEDVTTGYWLTYSPVGLLYVDLHRFVHDFQCVTHGARWRTSGDLRRPPHNTSVLVHSVKSGGFGFSLEQFAPGVAYNHTRCVHDACSLVAKPRANMWCKHTLSANGQFHIREAMANNFTLLERA